MIRSANMKKLKGSSLVEVLTAMLILVTMISLSTAVYVRFISLQPHKQLNIQEELAQLAWEVKQNQLFDNKQVDLHEQGIYIRQECSAYQDHADLIVLSLAAYSHRDKLIASHHEIIFRQDENH